MARAVRTQRKSGLHASLYLAVFSGTFALLAGASLPLIQAMTFASASIEVTGPALPAVPAKFETGPVLAMPVVASAATMPAFVEPPSGEPLPFGAPPVEPAFAELASVEPMPIVPPPVASAPVEPTSVEPASVEPPSDQTMQTERTAALPFGLFGSLEFRTNARKGTGPWRKALAQIDNEQPLYEFCDIGMLSCPPKYVAWRRLLSELRGLPAQEQLRRLNRGINGLIKHGDDAKIFQVSDHWASPMEFLQTGGDCEDYTILKYASLLELGYSDRQLRIAVVKDTKRQIDHAVLAVASQRGVTILDNLTDNPVPHARIRHYRPVYSVNRQNRWVHIATKQISSIYVASAKR